MEIKTKCYSQFTLNVTVVSRRWPSAIARFQTTHRNLAPSSSRLGVNDKVLVVWWSFEPPLLVGACSGTELPSRYHLLLLGKISGIKFLYNHSFWRNIYKISSIIRECNPDPGFQDPRQFFHVLDPGIIDFNLGIPGLKSV